MRQHVHAAVDRDCNTVQILRMRKDRHGMAMCLRDRGLGNGQGKDCNLTSTLVRTGEQLDAICAFRGMIAHQRNTLIGGFGVRNTNVVLVQKIADVHRLDCPNRLANGENVRAAKLIALDSAAECERVVEH